MCLESGALAYKKRVCLARLEMFLQTFPYEWIEKIS